MIKNTLRAVLIALALVFSLATPSLAQQPSCGPRESVVKVLLEKYGETRQNMGLATNQFIVETFANTETGSWTTLMTRPDMVSCLVASGVSYRNFEPENTDEQM